MSGSLPGVFNTDPLYVILHALPKVDLHTHLNGSISFPSLQHLAALLLGNDSATAEVFQFINEEQGNKHVPWQVAMADRGTADKGNVEMKDRQDEPSTTFTNPVIRMHQCFKIFDAIYKTMNYLDFTRVGIQDILFHYFSENTVYIELRASLRTGMYTTFEEHNKAVQNNCKVS